MTSIRTTSDNKKDLKSLITPTEKINGTRLFIFIHSITMF